MSDPLFRKEVMLENQTHWLGTVLLVPRRSYHLFAAFAAFATLGLLALLWFGHYTRKARIVGWLVPQKGMVQIFAPQAAVITDVRVTEGGMVQKDEPLLVLSSELRSAARGATQTEIAERLEARRQSLIEARAQIDSLSTLQSRSLAGRIGALGAEVAQLDSSIALQTRRVDIARKTEARQREVHDRGLISDQELQAATEALLDQESKLRELQRSRIESYRERMTLKGERDDLPFKARADMANLDRDIAEVEQQLAEVEAQREIVLPAPEAGTVTSVQAERGERADPSVPLLSIVPAGSKLEANLFTPSRAIGFLKPGQRVLLRYEAYPYQKFGHYDGTIAAISRSATNPSELPPQVAGLTRLTGSVEPVYRITVSLATQNATVYGKPVPLQPGMQLEADVLIDRRRLIEWVLDPLYSITGKLKT